MARARLAFAVAIFFLGGGSSGAEDLRLQPGGAEILRTDARTATVILGDPELADVTLVNERTIALTAKRSGRTTLLVLAADGSEVARYDLQIGAPQREVRVQSYKGTTGETRAYWCSLSSCIPPQDARPENVTAAVKVRTSHIDEAETETKAVDDGATPPASSPDPAAAMEQK